MMIKKAKQKLNQRDGRAAKKGKNQEHGSLQTKLRNSSLFLFFNRKLVLLFIIIALVSITSLIISSKDEDEWDHRIDNWYDVEDWEIAVCSKWGGAGEPQSYSGMGFTATGIASGLETVTLQGQKTVYNIEGQNSSVIYEASWYYQPFVGSKSYRVYLAKGARKELIFEGSSTAQTGDGNYHAEEFSTDPGFTHVLIEYDLKSLSTRIQEKEVST